MEKVKVPEKKTRLLHTSVRKKFLIKRIAMEDRCRSICATEELEAVCIPFIAEAHAQTIFK